MYKPLLREPEAFKGYPVFEAYAVMFMFIAIVLDK